MSRCDKYNCSNSYEWRCKNCKKLFCEAHSELKNHDCNDCYFCDKRATFLCPGCQHCICAPYGCDTHYRRCNSGFSSNTSSSRKSCKLCIKGRIPTNSFGDSVPCYNCYGTS